MMRGFCLFACLFCFFERACTSVNGGGESGNWGGRGWNRREGVAGERRDSQAGSMPKAKPHRGLDLTMMTS